jgi:hypothetical protein
LENNLMSQSTLSTQRRFQCKFASGKKNKFADEKQFKIFFLLQILQTSLTTHRISDIKMVHVGGRILCRGIGHGILRYATFESSLYTTLFNNPTFVGQISPKS